MITIHLLAPNDQFKWHSVWKHCYNIWESSPYEIKMWSDEEVDKLLKEDDEEFFNILNTLPPIYKFDYVRYIILEKFGGAYFDMDVEIINGSFLNTLNPIKMYFMECTLGSYIENSIMIATKIPQYNQDLFYRIKTYIKRKVIDNIEDCSTFNVLKYVGAYALSDWFSRYIHQTNQQYEILGQYQFASTTNEIVYTRHHQTSEWNK